MKKCAVALLLALVMLCTSVPVMAYTDDFILSDPVQATYTGTVTTDEIITNVSFRDIAPDHWAYNQVIQDAALNLVKGYNRFYTPDDIVTNEEALTFIVRAVGMEDEAVALAAQINNPVGLTEAWADGFLAVAADLGLLTAAEYQAALIQTELSAPELFNRYAPATRQDVARWIYFACRALSGTAFSRSEPIQKVFNYADYNDVAPDSVEAVEAMLTAGAMLGYPDGTFRPYGSIDRAEMADILYMLSGELFPILGLEKKTGTIGTVKDAMNPTLDALAAARQFYVRTTDGAVDLLQFVLDNENGGRQDAVTLKSGSLGGMVQLEEADRIEYVVRPLDNKVLYVRFLGNDELTQLDGQLQFVDTAENIVTVTDAEGAEYNFPLAEGLIYTEEDITYIVADGFRGLVSEMPYGTSVMLTLQGDTVIEIDYIGDTVLVNEVRGIVIENDPNFGTLTVVDNTGSLRSYNYYESDMQVRKRQYYDMVDEIGYIDSIFPDFSYNPLDAPISDIEAGDIVFLRPDPADTTVILEIYAATNYTARYGRIMNVTPSADGSYVNLLMEFENKQTGWYEAPAGIFVQKSGRPIAASGIMPGDWAKVLINQAIISPGYIMESVKEISIEGAGHLISNIVKGSLAGINEIERSITIQDCYNLQQTGWGNYSNLQSFSIDGQDIEYYNNGERVSEEYAMRFLKRSPATVYVAFEDNYAGERVRKVSFRAERDEELPADTVVNSDGAGSFEILSAGKVATDGGTIVRRHGRLVDGSVIMSADYAHVVLNGEGRAAVVDIYDAPDVSRISIARGRIFSIDEGSSFKVQSMSILSGNEWVYTPIQREFTIDHNTVFLDATGYVDRNTFMDYTAETDLDKVYNIIYDGAYATHVIDSGYATSFVTGTVYANNGTALSLNDAKYYNSVTGAWMPVSNTNAIADVTVLPNTVVGKTNAIVPLTNVAVGDVVRVLCVSLPEPMLSGAVVEGTIVLVEN